MTSPRSLQLNSKRIIIIDSLRGIALLGIICVHFRDMYGFPKINVDHVLLNYLIDKAITLFMVDKFNTIFAFIFGVSFYIQIRNSRNKDEQFRKIFFRRMLILLAFGYLHKLIYTWEVLMAYAFIGIVFMFMEDFKKKTLLYLSLLFLFIFPFLRFFSELIWSLNIISDLQKSDWSFVDLVKHNIRYSVRNYFYMYISSVTFMKTLGLFMFGFYVGKTTYFENLDLRKSLTKKIFYLSSLFFVSMLVFRVLGKSSMHSLFVVADPIILIYFNIILSVIYLTGSILLYQSGALSKIFIFMSNYGKMGLTNYIAQSVIGVTLFYSFGFGLGGVFYVNSFVRLLLALLVFSMQTFVCIYWLKYFNYGPIEWFWRVAIYKKSFPLRKI